MKLVKSINTSIIRHDLACVRFVNCYRNVEKMFGSHTFGYSLFTVSKISIISKIYISLGYSASYFPKQT